MAIITVDTSNPDLTKKRKFDPIPNDTYTFEVANNLVPKESKTTPGNQVVQIELVVTDDGEFKGRKVFDNLVIMGMNADPKSKAGCEQKIASFAMACGVMTKEQIEAGEGIDLNLFKGSICQAKVKIKPNVYLGETTMKNVVQEYLFESEDDE